MSIEIPQFTVALETDRATVTVAEHSVPPVVLFEMLESSTLRDYNANNPKEFSLFLGENASQPRTKNVVSELPISEACSRMGGIIVSFEAMCADYQGVSPRQLEALVDFARNRSLSSHIEE